MKIKFIRNISYEAIMANGKIDIGNISRNSYSDYYFEKTYNESGLLIREKTFWKDSNGFRDMHYFYDSDNNEIKYISYSSDGSIDIESEKFYNTNNMITKWKHKSNNNGSESLYEYFYDKQNRLIRIEITNNNKWYYQYEYIDGYEIGRFIADDRVCWETKRNTLFDECIYYDKDMQIETITTINNNKNGTRLNYKYETFNSKDKFIRYEEFKYDKYNNVIEKKEFINGVLENTNRFEYIYDENNNYIQCIEFINDIPKFIEKREIEYFDNTPCSAYIAKEKAFNEI